MNKFAERLKELYKEKSLGQRNLAKELGVNQVAIIVAKYFNIST